MRVPVLQEGGAPRRGEGRELAEKRHLLWLEPPVPSPSVPSHASLPVGPEAESGLPRGTPGARQRKLNRKRVQVAGDSAKVTVLEGPGGHYGRLTHLLVPAPDTAEDEESKEGQRAEGAPQRDSQEHCLVQPSG